MLKTMSTPGDTKWFVQDRFGMFIHWGLYALPSRHEWVKHNEKIPDDVYDRYFKHFDPDLYDPELWAKAAAGAGMKYFVITTKHHEGFCLWDSNAWIWTTAGISKLPSNFSPAGGSTTRGNPWSGRPARRSPAPGVITATRKPGRALINSSKC